MKISILIPTLNEAANLRVLLPALQAVRAQGHEVIVCDGGSQDGSANVAQDQADEWISAGRGRAIQMNAAARQASGDLLVFLHADSRPPADFVTAMLSAVTGRQHAWGRFDVRLDSERPILRLVAAMMNLRSRWTGIATGDQSLFVTRSLFDAVEGFPPIALMEDIAISKRLKSRCRPLCLRSTVTTSARRWERDGALATILRMWQLRFAYWLGADPGELAARYYGRQG